MEILYLIIFFILGSFVGTISTILGLRIPKKEKILGNKLHCDCCSHELTPKETIPLFSDGIMWFENKEDAVIVILK